MRVLTIIILLLCLIGCNKSNPIGNISNINSPAISMVDEIEKTLEDDYLKAYAYLLQSNYLNSDDAHVISPLTGTGCYESFWVGIMGFMTSEK